MAQPNRTNKKSIVGALSALESVDSGDRFVSGIRRSGAGTVQILSRKGSGSELEKVLAEALRFICQKFH